MRSRRRDHRGSTAAIASWATTLVVGAAGISAAVTAFSSGTVGPASGVQPNGRLLQAAGVTEGLGNQPIGAAVTPDGRFIWTLTGGAGDNAIEIISVDSDRMETIERLPMPGLSGGIAFAPDGRSAYVSGLPAPSGVQLPQDVPGRDGDVVHVFSIDRATGRATRDGTIAIPPPLATAPPQDFRPKQPIPHSWPEGLAVTPDRKTLLVALGLAGSAAVVDLPTRSIRYVRTGGYPYGAAVAERGSIGLVSNESGGTVSAIDLRSAKRIANLQVGPPLSHPEGIAVDASHHRAYVAVTGQDLVVALDTRRLRVLQSVSVESQRGHGSAPVAVQVAQRGRMLLAADSGEDAIAVVGVNMSRQRLRLRVLGRIPTAAYPIAAATANGGRSLLWVSAQGRGIGPNAEYQYIGAHIFGQLGILRFPTGSRLRRLSVRAASELRPVDASRRPIDTPIRANGPIKHVFFVVKENRTYDQVLGDEPRGDGDPSLTLFGATITPNLHALVQQFPLLDHVYADSAVSADGHSWTSAAGVTDYTVRNWPANYAGRGRPFDFGLYAISWPSTRFLFDRAEQQGISYRNYGEAYTGTLSLADADRRPSDTAELERRLAHSDLGSLSGGCYVSVLIVGGLDFLSGRYQDVFDSTPPAGANPSAESRLECFKRQFQEQLVAHAVPAFNYLVLPNDHTAATLAGARTPRAMVADNDYALGELVDLVSHSAIWKSSAILVVEDDAQSGADHVDAHRIPALVISPYTRAGAVVHDRFDQLSFIRTLELILGMRPLTMFDANATPLYSVLTPTAGNAAPYDAIRPKANLLERNTARSAAAIQSARLRFDGPDEIPEHVLDAILWKSVHGAHSTPPPPGPNAVAESGGGE